MSKYFFILLLIAGISTTGMSQQIYGYCNGGNLLEAVALKKGTEQALQAFSAPLVKKGQDKMLALKEKEKKFYEDIEKGILSQVAIQQRQQELGTEAQSIQDFEQSVVDDIEAKRQELLEPILKEVQEAIDAVAKEGGFSMIFDESLVGALLYSEGGTDIGPQVRSRLGL